MVYILDDNWDTERMVIRAGSAAFGLYVRCGMWAARQLSDGVIPLEIAASYGTPEWIRKLVEVGLWESNADGYLDLHYLKRNSTAEQAARRRSQKADRQRRWFENKNKKKRPVSNPSVDASHDASTDGSGDEHHLLPSSTRKEIAARPASLGAARSNPEPKPDPPWPTEDPSVIAQDQERLRLLAEARARELLADQQRATRGAAAVRAALPTKRVRPKRDAMAELRAVTGDVGAAS